MSNVFGLRSYDEEEYKKWRKENDYLFAKPDGDLIEFQKSNKSKTNLELFSSINTNNTANPIPKIVDYEL